MLCPFIGFPKDRQINQPDYNLLNVALSLKPYFLLTQFALIRTIRHDLSPLRQRCAFKVYYDTAFIIRRASHFPSISMPRLKLILSLYSFIIRGFITSCLASLILHSPDNNDRNDHAPLSARPFLRPRFSSDRSIVGRRRGPEGQLYLGTKRTAEVGGKGEAPSFLRSLLRGFIFIIASRKSRLGATAPRFARSALRPFMVSVVEAGVAVMRLRHFHPLRPPLIIGGRSFVPVSCSGLSSSFTICFITSRSLEFLLPSLPFCLFIDY